MANRALQAKALKLQRQNAARPRELAPTIAVTRDDVVVKAERLSWLNDARFAGCRVQRQLSAFRDREFVRVERTEFPIFREVNGAWVRVA